MGSDLLLKFIHFFVQKDFFVGKNSFFYILVSGDYIILALFTSIIVQKDSFLLIKVDKKLKNSISERNIEKEAFD